MEVGEEDKGEDKRIRGDRGGEASLTESSYLSSFFSLSHEQQQESYHIPVRTMPSDELPVLCIPDGGIVLWYCNASHSVIPLGILEYTDN